MIYTSYLGSKRPISSSYIFKFVKFGKNTQINIINYKKKLQRRLASCFCKSPAPGAVWGNSCDANRLCLIESFIHFLPISHQTLFHIWLAQIAHFLGNSAVPGGTGRFSSINVTKNIVIFVTRKEIFGTHRLINHFTYMNRKLAQNIA